MNRECGPACYDCGARILLSHGPTNQRSTQSSSKNCQNLHLQLKISKKTEVRRSRIRSAGWGLFAAEEIKALDYIDEYDGQVFFQQTDLYVANRRFREFLHPKPIGAV